MYPSTAGDPILASKPAAAERVDYRNWGQTEGFLIFVRTRFVLLVTIGDFSEKGKLPVCPVPPDVPQWLPSSVLLLAAHAFPFAPEVISQIVVLVEDEPYEREADKNNTSGLYEKSLWVGRHHDSTLDTEPVFDGQFESRDLILVQRATVGDEVAHLIELRQRCSHRLLAA
jgi:hypothetical protein